MTLLAYAWKAVTPLLAAYAIVASYPYSCNVPAVMAGLTKRLELREQSEIGSKTKSS